MRESRRDARLDSPTSAVRPVRILWLIDSLAPKAGTEQQALGLIKRIDPSRLAIDLAVFDDYRPDYIQKAFHKTASFPVKNIWSPAGFWQVLRLAEYMRLEKFGIVHGFMVKSGIASVLGGTLAGTPTILTSRRDLGYYYTPRWLKTVRLLNRRVTRLTANCEAARNVAAAAEGFDCNRIDVLYNGVDLSRFQPRTSVADESGSEEARALPAGAGRVVGIVANYREVKDLPLFIRAAAIISAEFPSTVFLLVGQGHLQPELEALAATLGIRDRVVFTAGRGDVPVWIRKIDIACLTSQSEGFSNSVLEYMASGVPVVAMDVGGIREAVEHGRTGLLVSERSPNVFAEAILTLLRNPAKAESMSRVAIHVCRERFGFEVAVRALEDYYLHLTGDIDRRKNAAVVYSL